MCMTAWNSPITPVKGQTLRGEACIEEVYSCYDCFVGGEGGGLAAECFSCWSQNEEMCFSCVCFNICCLISISRPSHFLTQSPQMSRKRQPTGKVAATLPGPYIPSRPGGYRCRRPTNPVGHTSAHKELA